jgi:hypothetical protein
VAQRAVAPGGFVNRYIVSLAAGTLFLALLPSALGAQIAHTDLQDGKKLVHTVLILPAQARVVKSGVKGNEPLVEESRALEGGLTAAVLYALTSAGCNVLPSAFGDESLSQNPDLKYALADLQTRFDKVWDQLAKKPKDVRTGRFTLGDDVANFSPGATADVLVFVRGEEAVFTGGRKLLGALAGGYVPSQAVTLRIALVDAQSGVVLYVDEAPPGIVQKDIEKSFKKFGNPKAKK